MFVIPNIQEQLEGSDKVQLDIFDDNTIRFLLSPDYENSSEWKFIKKINMRNSFITKQAIEMLAAHKNLEKIQEIDFSKNYSTINDQFLQILLQSKYATNLRKLDLTDTDITDETIQLISDSKSASTIQSLILYGNYQITIESMKMISKSDQMANLICLDLRATCITDEGIEELCKSKNAQFLKTLDLSMNGKQITDRTVDALTFSQHIKKLKCLRLASTCVTDKSLCPYIESYNCQYIRELDLSNEKDVVERKKFLTRITDNFLIFLSKSTYLNRIKRLNLRATEITSKGMKQFSMSYNADSLVNLRISWNMGIDDQTLLDIASNYEEKIKRLQKLYVNDTCITPVGVESIMKQIPYLDLIFNVEIGQKDSFLKKSNVSTGKGTNKKMNDSKLFTKK